MPTTLRSSAAIFAKIGLLSFGGPAAQISLMHRFLVDENPWLTERQFLGGLNFCMLLPGPEAMQLATYAGWRLHGILGGLIAGLLFVLPGAALVLALAIVYVYLGELPLITTLFVGIKAAVLIIVIEALLKLSRRALVARSHWIIASLAFVAIFFFRVPFPLIILTAALQGYLQRSDTAVEPEPALPVDVRLSRTLLIMAAGIVLWSIPFLLILLFDGNPVLTQVGAFFSRLAVVTFGGAYAVLAYMGQDVVDTYGWLTTGEMMDGLGLAETTPGPLILVTEFVGFVAAFRTGGLATGLAAAAVTLWVTFVPCFIWVFAGAPYIEWISSRPRLRKAMSAITAAVVGVMLNLALWFALHVVFRSVDYSSYGPLSVPIISITDIDWRVPLLSLLSAALLLRARWNIVTVLVAASTSSYLLTRLMG